MDFKAISANDAQRLLRLWQTESIEKYEYAVGPANARAAASVGNAIKVLRDLHGRSQGRSDWAAFDGEAAVAFHSAIGSLPSAIEKDRGFWIWTALQLFNVIEWRHARPEGAHRYNYGLGARTSNYPMRLWLRASSSYDDLAADPYELTRRGTVDFWESGIIRHRYSSCRALVRAFVRYQYPAPSGRARLHPTHPDGLRSLYRILRREYAKDKIAIRSLDDAGAYALLHRLGSQLRPA